MKSIKIPILYVGAPGTGKTATVQAQYDHCEILLLSSQAEEDIAGIPYRDGLYEKRTIPAYIQRLQQAKGITCLFLDELDKARREVADTLLTLITNPCAFGIPEETEIVAAANPPEWGGGDGISQPMLNRFSVINFAPNFDNWKTYMLQKYGVNEFLNLMIKKLEVREIPFLEANGEGLNWRMTSPRSLENVIKVCLYETSNIDILIKGLVTPNAASGILELYRKYNKSQNKDIENSNPQSISRGIGSSALRRTILRKSFGELAI